MPRNTLDGNDLTSERVDPPILPHVTRRQKYFPSIQPNFLSSTKWKLVLILPALSVALAYAYSMATVDKHTSVTSIRRYPIPKPKADITNQFKDKTYRIAARYFNKYQRLIKNKQYLTVIDYTKPSYTKRMSIINLKTHKVERYLVAHGKNSGIKIARNFSNRPNSYKSCRGLFLTGSPYYGTHGKSLHLLGLERGVNDRALDRGIVIHGAGYVNNRSIMLNGGYLGRSWGCPAVPIKEVNQIVDKIKNGSLLYIHGTS